MAHRFFIVDVFAEGPYMGNPLAVVVADKSMSEQTMQQIAVETNYSETTFLHPNRANDGGYMTRMFTPAREIAFAGHPLLGTAHVVRRFLDPDSDGPVRLNLPDGHITVTFETTDSDGTTAWFKAPAITPGPICDRAEMAAALGIEPNDIDPGHPVQQMGAGTSAMIVPIKSMAALMRSRLDLDAYAPLAARGFPPLTYLFCTETRDNRNDLCARFFFEAHGVREDPATGNGAAFLGAYLLLHDGHDVDVRIEQGHNVRRPSLVRLRATVGEGSPGIFVGGHVVTTVQGELV